MHSEQLDAIDFIYICLVRERKKRLLCNFFLSVILKAAAAAAAAACTPAAAAAIPRVAAETKHRGHNVP